MSLLHYVVMPNEGIIILTDTLALNTETQRPGFFATKVYLLPHLRMAMCGTGDLSLIIAWHRAIVTRIVSRDIADLDVFTPELLRSVCAEGDGGREYSRATLYHLGYSLREGRFLGFAYRSTSNFESERLPGNSWGIKPAPKGTAPEVGQGENVIAELIAIAERQKQDDDDLVDRVGIGGELVMVFLRETSAAVEIVHRFDDYELELTRSCGHIPTWGRGVHDAEEPFPVPAGVPAADRRAGPCRA